MDGVGGEDSASAATRLARGGHIGTGIGSGLVFVDGIRPGRIRQNPEYREQNNEDYEFHIIYLLKHHIEQLRPRHYRGVTSSQYDPLSRVSSG
jgi:hypothetical protein